MITAVICAAGRGSRAGYSENKILHEYLGMPVLCYSLSAFAPFADEILVTCAEEDEARVNALLSPFPDARTVRGGSTRGESVYNALKEAKGDIVLVHDGARPFVTAQTISECIASVKLYGSGVCAIPATDTVVIAENGSAVCVPDRSAVYAVQTPQGFRKEKLLDACERARKDGASFTDESGLYGAYCEPPRLTAGDRNNRKLTYAEDFSPAERAGFGVDTHAFGKRQDYITLAGVKIPSESGLIAHSDGDVLLHALMDALLSAAGLRDIGYYFPDTDGRYKDADSAQLLKEVVELLSERNFAPQNISISVLAEKPRLAPYIEEIKQNLSSLLALPRSAVGVSAGTNEKLGYIGEGKGVTVYACVLLKRK